MDDADGVSSRLSARKDDAGAWGGESTSELRRSRDDPATKRVLFDLSYVPAPEEGKAVISALVLQMRRIGIDRFLFGSDYNVLTPAEAVSFMERLGLTEKEQDLLRQNCAPWVCPDTARALGTEYSLRGDDG